MLFRKVRRFGLCSSTCACDVSEYLSLADSKLFKSIQSPSHCLSHILPPEKNLSGLRSRGHGYVLPICQYSFCKNSFISRNGPMHILFLSLLPSVYDSFFGVLSFRFFQHLRFSFVVLLIKREISPRLKILVPSFCHIFCSIVPCGRLYTLSFLLSHRTVVMPSYEYANQKLYNLFSLWCWRNR